MNTTIYGETTDSPDCHKAIPFDTSKSYIEDSTELWNVSRNLISYYKRVHNYGTVPSKLHIYGTHVHNYGSFGKNSTIFGSVPSLRKQSSYQEQ